MQKRPVGSCNWQLTALRFKNQVVMEPLQYTELVNNFAFGSDVYVILYLVIGTGLCAAGVVYWSVNRDPGTLFPTKNSGGSTPGQK